MSVTRFTRLGVLLTLGAVLAACGGALGEATIGGVLSGLASGTSVTLQNNGSESLQLNSNGSFNFVNGVAASSNYSVAVTTQPVGQTCSISGSTGTVDNLADNVKNVLVTCTSSASLGGTVSGLHAGTSITLQAVVNGVSTPLTVATNGSFAFTALGTIAAGTTYNVTLTQQPAVGSCTISGNTGTIVSGSAQQIAVTCV